MKQARNVFFYLLFLASISVLVFSTARVIQVRKNLPPDFARADALMVHPVLLKVLSGEFKGLVADYLHMKIAVFLGGNETVTPHDFETLYLMAKQSLALDPYFYQNTYFLQGYLVWKKEMAGKVIDLLKIQAKHRFWDWEPNWFIGFNYLHFFRDRVNAYRYLETASKNSNAPTIVGALAARLAQDQHGTQVAIAMLKTMIDGSDDEDYKKVLAFRLQSYIGIYQIEQALDVYQKRYKRLPETLGDLVETGIIDRLPLRPDGKSFFYNAESGAVLYDGSAAFK
jgi:hypothetical protein